MGGRCVRLTQGDPTRRKVYFASPLEAAGQMETQGAELIHVIDLDAALGSGDNMETIKTILQTLRVKVQVGGGVRTIENAKVLIELGAYRVIFGTAAVQNPALIENAVRLFGSRSVAVAIDEKHGNVALHGWRDISRIPYLQMAQSYEAMNIGALIFTSTSVDGTLKGPQTEKLLRLMDSVRIPVIASGGVADLTDLIALADTGVAGVIVGTALYERKFTFTQALEVIKKC